MNFYLRASWWLTMIGPIACTITMVVTIIIHKNFPGNEGLKVFFGFTSMFFLILGWVSWEVCQRLWKKNLPMSDSKAREIEDALRKEIVRDGKIEHSTIIFINISPRGKILTIELQACSQKEFLYALEKLIDMGYRLNGSIYQGETTTFSSSRGHQDNGWSIFKATMTK